jgi:hypothetical protein
MCGYTDHLRLHNDSAIKTSVPGPFYSLGFDAGPGELQTPLYSNLWYIFHYVAFPSFICPLSLRLGRILLYMDSRPKAMAFRRWNRPKLSAIAPTARPCPLTPHNLYPLSSMAKRTCCTRSIQTNCPQVILTFGGWKRASDNTGVKECLADSILHPALWRHVQRVVDAIRDEKRSPGFVHCFDTQEDLDADAVMRSPCLLIL